jgi:hypothetical protein
MIKKTILLIVIIFIFNACKNSNIEESTWKSAITKSKTINNITYYFPSDVSSNNRKEYIMMCQNAIKENLKLLKETTFENKMDIQFLHSRTEMKNRTGMAAQGMAMFEQNTFYSILRMKNSPVAHEMNHMIAFYKYGMPHENWIAEGLGTLAGGTCSNYSLEEIYQYYLQSNKLIPMDIIVNDFWKKGNNDIITYTQSAFIVKYLLDNYGHEKFKTLWADGFEKFNSIYGFEFKDLETKIKTELKLKYPKEIPFNWEEFNKGCT